MLDNISTDNAHRKNIWTDSLNNIFYNGCISDEEIKVYCFGDGGGSGGGSGDGGVAGDFGAAEAGLGAIGETSGTGGKSGTQSDDTGISDAITDAMSGTLGGTMSDDAAFGPAFGPSVVDADVPDSTESFYSSEDIEAAFPSSFSIIGSPLGILGSALLSAIPVIGPVLGVASTVMGAIGTIGDVTGIAGLSAIGDFSPTSLASKGLSSLATEMGVPSNVTSALSSPVLSVEAGNEQTGLASGFVGGLVDIADPQAQTQFGIDVPIGKDTIAPARDALSDVAKSVKGGLSELADTIGITNQPSQAQPVSTQSITPTVTERSPSGGLVNIIQNPLTVRPQEEILPTDDSEGETRRRIIRRPTGAQTGGGIQNLINQQPSLIDVVNRGMAMPDETIPSQRPEQFIKGQQQPGGLRSTNYYTNAMQPASFYAQPQQVRNYGSIY